MGWWRWWEELLIWTIIIVTWRSWWDHGSIYVVEGRMNEKVVIENIMLFLDVLLWSRSKAATGMKPITTHLSEMYLHLWREVFCRFSETESAWLLVPYVRSILDVYMNVYHAFYLSLFRWIFVNKYYLLFTQKLLYAWAGHLHPALDGAWLNEVHTKYLLWVGDDKFSHSFPYFCLHCLLIWQLWHFLTCDQMVCHIIFQLIALQSVSSRCGEPRCCR